VAAVEASSDMALAAGLHRDSDVAAVLQAERPQVLIDFTVPPAAVAHARAALAEGVAPVVGTTGIGVEEVDELERTCRERGLGGCVIPNFAIGAVLLSHFAAMAAPYFDDVEIEERHHSAKLDSPSGTALATARAVAKARQAAGAQSGAPASQGPGRGQLVEGVPVHSLRLSGVLAEQEAVLSSAGQTLSLIHRTTSRSCYGPGLLQAIRAVLRHRRFYRSLVEVLELEGEQRSAGA
jgi:4-hydroxy-tetrahydrodipicolinate reductase